MLEGLIPSSEDGPGKDVTNDHLQRLIIFAIMFSLGALLELDDRKKVTIWFEMTFRVIEISKMQRALSPNFLHKLCVSRI